MKIGKRITSLLLALVMCVSMCPVSYAEETELTEGTSGEILVEQEEAPLAVAEIWDGSIATAFASGNGTKAFPYQIANGAQLARLNSIDTTSKHFILTADIVLNDVSALESWATTAPANNWTPIQEFKGYLDGQDYTISGLYVSTTNNNAGLFGKLSSEAIVQKLMITDSLVSGNGYSGGIVGYLASGTLKDCVYTGSVSGSSHVGGIVGYSHDTIENCTSSGTIKGKEDVGGVVGYNYGILESCTHSGAVNGTENVGGVTGRNTYTVKSCTNSGTVTGSSSYVGGVVGYNKGFDREYSGGVTNCTNSGTVTGSSSYVGGLVGYNYSYTSMTDCTNSGDVISSGNYVGGVVGYIDYGSVKNCSNSGDVAGSGNVGGVVGCMSFTYSVKDCTNSGIITGSNKYVGGIIGNNHGGYIANCANFGVVSSTSAYVGGVVGLNYAFANTSATDTTTCVVTGCSNTAIVSGTDYVGGVAGKNEHYVTDCTNSGEVFGTDYVGGVTGHGAATKCTNSGDVSGIDYVGGVTGYVKSQSIKNCANSGYVEGVSKVGGVAGYNSGFLTSSFNTGSVSGETAVGGVAGLNNSTVTNSYYLDTCGAVGVGIAKTADQFASGEVAYLMNGDQSTIVWYQTCGEGLPAFSGQTVYQVTGCDGQSVSYSNTPGQTGSHSYKAVVTEPTCTDGGFTTYTCSVCGDSYVGNETEASGHSYDAVVTKPTCTDGGFTTYTCSACGDSYVGNETEASGHSYDAVVTKPTCTDGGFTTYTCSVCGDSYVGDETEASGHSYDEGTIITPSTCTSAGEKRFTCTDCGDTKIEPIASIGHSYNAAVTEPTCTDGGFTTYTCSVCGDSYVGDETAATSHSWTGPANACIYCGIVPSGSCGETAEWSFDASTGTLTISGTGAMDDYIGKTVPWKMLAVEHLVVEPGITSVGAYAFAFCKTLISVSLPEGLTTLGDAAFYGAKNLVDITLPESLTKILSSALGMTGITKITIPAAVTTIGEYAFMSCGSLEQVTFEGSVPVCTKEMSEYPSSLNQIFFGTSTEIHYPAHNETWTEEVRQSFAVYGQDLTWVADHEWIDATCKAPKTCSICSITEGDPLPHTEEILPGKDATETEPGLTEGKKCSVCGEVLVKQEEISATGVWNGSVADAFAGGSGTQDDPYQIATGEQLARLGTINTSGLYFIQIKDIKLNGEAKTNIWKPIAAFKGHFDGQSFTISGLYVNTTEDNAGLLGKISSGSTVQNVILTDSSVIGSCCVGGVVANNSGSVKNCSYTGSVSGDSEVGGVVGCNYRITANCANTGSVSGSGDYIGGVVGCNYSTAVNCFNTGSVSGSGDYVGGVVGDNTHTVTNCYYLESCGAVGAGTAKTAERFASGEVTYLLNGDQSEIFWYQTCGEGLPAFSGQTVYAVLDCGGTTLVGYSNTADVLPHTEEIIPGIAPTKTEPGLTEGKKCSVCGEITVAQEEIPPTFGIWNGTAADSFAGGSGTESDPYQIATAEQLAHLNTISTSGLYFIQVDNIILNNVSNVESWDTTAPANNWMPIAAFDGYYDGQNYTISGLYVSTTNSNAGLFGKVSSGGTVENVTVVDSYVSGSDIVGGIIGRNFGTVAGCSNSGTVTGSSTVGGVVGYTPSGTVRNCSNSGTVTGTASTAGGVVGSNYRGAVANCANTGSVSGTSYVGGVVGNNSDSGTVANCINTGSVNGTSFYVGGAVGYTASAFNVTNCYYLNTCGAVGKGTARTAEQFASGEVTWLLNSDQSETVWYQTCGEGLPAFSGRTVYAVMDCSGKTRIGYSNTAGQTGPHSHEAVVTDPTCTEGGFTTYTCSVCGDNYTADETAALGHTEEIIPGKAPTFEEPGLTEGKKCSVCGEITEAPTVLDKLGHSYKAVVTSPTCTEDGYTTYTCTVCGDTYRADEIPAPGHTEEIIPGKEPTKTEPGLTEGRKCTVCGETLVTQEEIPPTLGIWNGTAATAFAGGDGTKENPYQIATAEQLAKLAFLNNTSGIYFIQTDNIILNDISDLDNWGTTPPANSWTPIPGFHGHYDGQNYTVSGMYISTTDSNLGLFGGVSGTIQNVNVTDSYVSGVLGAAGVVGCNNSSGVVKNCTNSGTISGRTQNVGGVVGVNYGTVETCINTGTVSGGGSAGGVVGANQGNAIVKNCINTGAVTGSTNIGGVVGYNFQGTIFGTVENCINTGTVSGTGSRIGGVVGYGTSVYNCYYLNTCGAAGEGTAKTAQQFASGEVTYLLNGDQSEFVWYQTCGEGLPAFNGKIVYAVMDCGGKTPVDYSNTAGQGDSHSYSGSTTEPTCTEDGFVTYTCGACGHSYEEKTEEALGHSEVIDAAVAPTYWEDGRTEGKHCSVCDEVLLNPETQSRLKPSIRADGVLSLVNIPDDVKQVFVAGYTANGKLVFSSISQPDDNGNVSAKLSNLTGVSYLYTFCLSTGYSPVKTHLYVPVPVN